MKSIILTLVLFCCCFYLIAYSHWDFLTIAAPALILIGILATLFASVWIKGNFWQRQKTASKITFPLTAIVFLAGYFYKTLIVMML